METYYVYIYIYIYIIGFHFQRSISANTHEVTEHVQHVDVTKLAQVQYSQIIRMKKFLALMRNYTTSTKVLFVYTLEE